jgi:hypothetical protein
MGQLLQQTAGVRGADVLQDFHGTQGLKHCPRELIALDLCKQDAETALHLAGWRAFQRLPQLSLD